MAGETTIVKWVDANGDVHMVGPLAPLPVAVHIAEANLTIDPFTDDAGANIVPGTVRSSATGAFRAVKVHCHFAAVTSNPITIALDAFRGVEYDTVLHIETMGVNQDATYYFPANAKFEAGDIITVAWTNDIGAVAWSVEIGWEE